MKTTIGELDLELVGTMAQATNDELSLTFRTSATLLELDGIFSNIENLSTITVIDEETDTVQFMFKNFVEYLSLEKKKFEEDYCYTVKLLKNDLASSLTSQITELQMALVDMYEMIGG